MKDGLEKSSRGKADLFEVLVTEFIARVYKLRKEFSSEISDLKDYMNKFEDGILRIKEQEESLNVAKDKIKSLLDEEASKHKKIIDRSVEEQIKSQFLWHLSVIKRIGIKQTIRTKSLYPQLVIFNEDKPVTFYPQMYGKEDVAIKEFLEGLLRSKIRCLHDEKDLKELLMRVKK